MAPRFSTFLVNQMMENLAVKSMSYTASTIAGVSSPKTFTDSANGFLTAGLRPGGGETIVVVDGHNNTVFTTVSVVAGTITVNESVTAFSAGSPVTIVSFSGGSFRDLMKNSVLVIYGGSQPASPDATEGTTPLLVFTENSGAFVAGQPANGLNFIPSGAVGIVQKDAGVWSGNGVANGTATWFRLYSNGYNTGVDTSLAWARADGSIGVSGSGQDLIVASQTITNGAPYTINTFTVTLPQHA